MTDHASRERVSSHIIGRREQPEVATPLVVTVRRPHFRRYRRSSITRVSRRGVYIPPHANGESRDCAEYEFSRQQAFLFYTQYTTIYILFVKLTEMGKLLALFINTQELDTIITTANNEWQFLAYQKN